MHELSNQAVIITGASRGIGAAAATEFANSGAKVLLAARSENEIQHNAQLIRDAGGSAEAVACDVSNYQDMQALATHCETTFGRLDILINNAGVIEPIGLLETSDPIAWAQAADINFKGVYFGIRAVLPKMLAQQSGCIINVGSGAAHSPLEGWSHYCSAKAATHMLTRCVDRETNQRGVRVIGLSPGTVATDMQRVIRASGINPVSQMDPNDHIDALWPARALLWLCTAEAQEYTGKEVSLRDEIIRQKIGMI